MNIQNIFYRAFVNYLKIAKSEIYIARIKITLFVNDQHIDEVFHLEANSIKTLNDLVSGALREKSQCLIVQFDDESFSSVKNDYVKYRGCDVIQSQEMHNLIKTK